MSLESIARAKRISLGEAAALAEREHWPRVFRLRETVVLAPREMLARG